jgi:hypothetical protein
VHGVGRVQAEAGGEHAVVGRRRAAALDVPEHGRPGLLAGAPLDLVAEQLPDAAQADVAERVELPRTGRHAALLGHRALGDDEDRRELAGEAGLDVLADLVDVEGPLGDEDDVGAAGQAGVQRDPAGVAAHDLDDERPVVGLGRGVQAVDGVDAICTAVSKPNV